jgi:Na+/phosphate symporter
MKKDIKDALLSLHKMGNDIEDCMYLLQTSFIYNSSKHLNDCRTKLSDVIKSGNILKEEVMRLDRENVGLKPYGLVPEYLCNIAENIEQVSGRVEKKSSDGILFSDKALEEVTFLIQRLLDIMRPTSDIILARNEILSNYVKESEADVVRKALEYSTLHEERLIGGICQPAASTLYVNMLDSIKNIAWLMKKIATELMA